MNIIQFINPNAFVGAAETTEKKPYKLIYRGFTYDYSPRPVANYYLLTTQANISETQKIKLIYRGQKIDYIPRRFPAYRQPNAINWRYRVA